MNNLYNHVVLAVAFLLTGCGPPSDTYVEARSSRQKTVCEREGFVAVPVIDQYGRVHFYHCEQPRPR